MYVVMRSSLRWSGGRGEGMVPMIGPPSPTLGNEAAAWSGAGAERPGPRPDRNGVLAAVDDPGAQRQLVARGGRERRLRDEPRPARLRVVLDVRGHPVPRRTGQPQRP